jgi:hypothetical protein
MGPVEWKSFLFNAGATDAAGFFWNCQEYAFPDSKSGNIPKTLIF